MKTFKLRLIILVIALSAATGMAQETTPDYKKFSIGMSATPFSGYRHLKNGGSIPLIDLIFESRNTPETPKVGYSAGVQLQYHISQKIGLEIGVQSTSIGFTYAQKGPIFIIPNDPVLPQDIEIRYNWDYLEIPLKLIISPGTKKLRFSASAGMITGVLLNAWQKNIYTFSNGQETTTQQYQNTTSFRTVVFSPQVSLGATYHISPKFKVKAEPMFRYAIQTVANTPIRANLYAGGIFIGFYYNL